MGYGVRWQEFNKKDQAVMKEKCFATDEARAKFVAKLEQKDNFWRIDSWWSDKPLEGES